MEEVDWKAIVKKSKVTKSLRRNSGGYVEAH